MSDSRTILVADDDRAIRTVLSQALGRSGYQVRATSSASTLWRWVEDGEGDLVITDVVMPDENGLDLVPAHPPGAAGAARGGDERAVHLHHRGEGGPARRLRVPAQALRPEGIARRGGAGAGGARTTPSRSEGEETEERLPLIGRSPAMQEIYRTVARLTTTDLTVMITGESGTGKELVARALHDYGRRRAGPFVAVNMAAIPRELIESELFGHERGAFTGALNRGVGRFEQAAGGTLFLDEIGDMPAEAQTRLLRVLAGRRVHHRRRPAAGQGQCPHRRRDPPRPPPVDPAGLVPRGPVLPAQRGADPPAAAPRAGG